MRVADLPVTEVERVEPFRRTKAYKLRLELVDLNMLNDKVCTASFTSLTYTQAHILVRSFPTPRRHPIYTPTSAAHIWY